jgi:hypothetical protein
MEFRSILISLFILCALGLAAFVFSEIGKSAISGGNDLPGSQVYSSPSYGFEIRVPRGYTTDEAYINQTFGPGKEITGVSFIVPESLSKGTNLSADSHIAVEQLRDVECTPTDFLSGYAPGVPSHIGAYDFLYASESGAGAGNFYEDFVYVTKSKDLCYAVRLLMHSTNIGNYDPGTIVEFNRQDMLLTFKAVVATLRIVD